MIDIWGHILVPGIPKQTSLVMPFGGNSCNPFLFENFTGLEVES